MSTAQTIAAAFGDDGMQWTTGDGHTFRHLVVAARGVGTYLIVDGSIHSIRWTFPDGSALVAADGAWDIGFDAPATCHCWAGMGEGHDEGCAE